MYKMARRNSMVLGVLNVLNMLNVLNVLYVLHALHGRIVGLLGLGYIDNENRHWLWESPLIMRIVIDIENLHWTGVCANGGKNHFDAFSPRLRLRMRQRRQIGRNRRRNHPLHPARTSRQTQTKDALLIPIIKSDMEFPSGRDEKNSLLVTVVLNHLISWITRRLF